MSFLFAPNTISMGFLIALITHSIDSFVALEINFERELFDFWTFHRPNFIKNLIFLKNLTFYVSKFSLLYFGFSLAQAKPKQKQ